MTELLADRATQPVVCLSGHATGEGLKEIRLCPDGHVKSTKGHFVVD